MMRESGWRCLQRRGQLAQEQLPPQAQPPEVEAGAAASLVPTIAKVENIAFVLVLSHWGQTWR